MKIKSNQIIYVYNPYMIDMYTVYLYLKINVHSVAISQLTKSDPYLFQIEMTAAPGTQTCVDGVQNVPKEPAKRVTNYQKVAHRIDQLSRYIFPSIFLIFNIVYWPYYGAMRER